MEPNREERFADKIALLSGIVPAAIGWSVDQFWRATPAELAAVFAALADAAAIGENGSPLGKSEINKLKEQHPDG